MNSQPFITETQTLLQSVSQHDFDTLAALCDDDFGIVDISPTGGSVAIRSRRGWEAWFQELFATLEAMDAETTSHITEYHAIKGQDLGYSVVYFRQELTYSGRTAAFDCVATIVWKQTSEGWKEARWHCSVLRVDTAGLPELAHLKPIYGDPPGS